jgi:plastocyanin
MLIQVRSTICLVAIALGVAGCHRSPAAPEPQTVDVFTPGNSFSPFSMRVPAGTVVRYNIFGDDHNVIFSHTVAGYPADINVVKDVVVSRTFPTRGTFSYTCTVHPGMNGEIIVE